MTIEIAYAKYNGTNGRKEIGIAAWRLPHEGVITQVRITQTYKTGKMKGRLIYPTLYCMPTEKIVKYPKQVVSNNTVLHIVPLDDFKPKVFDLKEKQFYEKNTIKTEYKTAEENAFEEAIKEADKKTKPLQQTQKKAQQASMF